MSYTLKRIEDIPPRALENFKWDDTEIVPYSFNYYWENGYEKYVANLKLMETDPPRPLVPSTDFFLMDGDNIVGIIDIRHRLNEGLKNYGGHIGYGVAPAYRGHNLAEKMVRMAAPFMREIGIEKVLICCDIENKASYRTIEKLGGVLENTLQVQRSGRMITGCRFWVDLSAL